MTGDEALVLSRAYTKATAEGMGAVKGKDGSDGASAYEVAVGNGFMGTVAEWLESLKGEKGDTGYSPTATVAQDEDGATISVTDESGTTTATVKNGQNGKDGQADPEQIAEAVAEYMTENPISVDAYTKAESDEKYQGKSDVLSGLSDDGSGNLLYNNSQIKTDLSGYSTTEQMDEAISGSVSAHNTSETAHSDIREGLAALDDKIPTDYVKTADLGEYAKSADVTAEIGTATADMATNTAVDAKLADYAKNADLPVNVSDLVNDSGYQTQAEVMVAVSDGIAKVVADAPEDLDTLKEMSDWISGHEESAAAMNSAIKANADDIAGLQTDKADAVISDDSNGGKYRIGIENGLLYCEEVEG